MEPASNQGLTLDRFAQYVKCKKDLYQLALKNGYYLPKETSSINTEEYLMSVLRGACWCPKFKDVRLMPCPRPPSKEQLLKKVLTAAAEHGHHSIGIQDSRLPDVKWLVDVLATLRPDDEIFRKDYVPPPKRQRKGDSQTVSLAPELFEGLPPSTSKVKARRLKVVGEALTRERVEYLKFQQKELGVALLEQQIRLEQIMRLSEVPPARIHGVREEQKKEGASSITIDLQAQFKQPSANKPFQNQHTPMQGVSSTGPTPAARSSSISSSKQPQSINGSISGPQ